MDVLPLILATSCRNNGSKRPHRSSAAVLQLASCAQKARTTRKISLSFFLPKFTSTDFLGSNTNGLMGERRNGQVGKRNRTVRDVLDDE